MSFLALLLIVKIAVTLVLVVVPLILAAPDWITRFSGLKGDTALFRLYGMALLALLVGYAMALWGHWQGDDVVWVVPMGMVSNGGAALILLTTYTGRFRAISVTFFTAITLGLFAIWLWPEPLMASLW